MEKDNRALEFRALLSERAIIADGAMGSMLYSKGIFINRCYDELNVSAPDIVKGIHLEYAAAGAEILESNTFGANRIRLGLFGLGDKLQDINKAGVRLAREASGKSGFVAGAVGPLGVLLEPSGSTTLKEARALFSEHIQALFEAGVDLIMLETFGFLNELREAIFAAREIVGDSMVIVAQAAMDDSGKLCDGAGIETFARQLDVWPADVLGCNCTAGPKTTLEIIEQMMKFTSKPMSAMPNAGHPARVEGRNIYLCSPEYIAQYARRLLLKGVRIIGGCCGTTPEHIKSLRAEARSLQPVSNEQQVLSQESAAQQSIAPRLQSAAEKSQLGAKLTSGKFVTFIEILSPRGVDCSREIDGAKLCASRGIDCINVPDGPRASSRMSAQVACRLIQEQAGIEAVLHFCCRDRNLLGIQSELLGAHASGIRNLICITGDPPRMGSYPDATAVFDVDSIGLVRIARNLNLGLDIGGKPIGSNTALLIGVGADPGALNFEEELRRLELKANAGAEYIVTQPVFDMRLFEKFLRSIRHIGLPVIAGIWPLISYRNAAFLSNELRVPVPQTMMHRMRQADTAEAARQEGIAIAQQLALELKSCVQGIQFSAPFGQYPMALEVYEAIKNQV